MSDWKKKENWNTMRTAILTAYPKLFTDIPYAPQLFFHAIRLAVEYGFSFEPSLFVEKMSLEIEARHKALNAALREQIDADTLVVELGAGLSPRRLEFTDTAYCELDYPPIADMKRRIYEKMGQAQRADDVFDVDLTDLQAVEEFSRHLKQRKYAKIVVLSEGLFWYLRRVHLRGLVSFFSEKWKGQHWVWLTADCPVAKKIHAPYRKIISDSSDKDPNERFVDYEDFRAFFESCGCSVMRRKLTEFLSPEAVYAGKFFSVSAGEVEKRMCEYTDIALIAPRR